MSRIRIKLASSEINDLNKFTDEVLSISDKIGAEIKGPIPTPTKRIKITTRKSPCGDGKASFDNFQMRVHKRIIEFSMNDRMLKQIMRAKIPKSLNIELKVIQ